jgi:hypothetical protein
MYHCSSCGKLEKDCRCERFCSLCQADYTIRLCEDGYCYCEDCRDACDYRCDDKDSSEIAI